MVNVLTTVLLSRISMRWMIPVSQGQKFFCWLLCSNQFWSHKFSFCIYAGISDLCGKAAGTSSWSLTFFSYRCLECGELGLQVTHVLYGECFDVVTAVCLLYDENSHSAFEVLPSVTKTVTPSIRWKLLKLEGETLLLAGVFLGLLEPWR
jgi:hypothetical protein